MALTANQRARKRRCRNRRRRRLALERKQPQNVECPYCGDVAEFVTGETIHPHRKDLHTKKFYLCNPCGAYVGCHKGTAMPLGRLADADLRAAKIKAHAAFDPLWRNNTNRTREEAYAWLARELNIGRAECHIGMFDLETCRRVIAVCG